MRKVKTAGSERLRSRLARIPGLECWYVCAGGASGSAFSLAFGRKVRRAEPLANPTLSDEFRQHDGEQNLYVWCSWRVDSPEMPVVSSDAPSKVIAERLELLIGQRVVGIDVRPPAWDLSVQFERHSLHVFCDHLPGEPSFDGNWEVNGEGGLAAVGPGAVIDFE